MIEIIEAYKRSGKEWCFCCQKAENIKQIKFSYNGWQNVSVVLCDDCRRELYRVLSESEGYMQIECAPTIIEADKS